MKILWFVIALLILPIVGWICSMIFSSYNMVNYVLNLIGEQTNVTMKGIIPSSSLFKVYSAVIYMVATAILILLLIHVAKSIRRASSGE